MPSRMKIDDRLSLNRCSWKSVLLAVFVVLAITAPHQARGSHSSTRDDCRGFEAHGAADAFPAETLYYLEIARPVEFLERLDRTGSWPASPALLAGLPWSLELVPPAALAGLSSAWDASSGYRSRLDCFAGRRMVIAWVPLPDGSGTEVIFAFQGDGSGDPLDALEWIAAAAGRTVTLQCDEPDLPRSFWILGDHDDLPCWGQAAGGWVVFSHLAGVEAVKQASAALAQPGSLVPGALSGHPEFVRIRTGLPRTSNVLGYLNTGNLLDLALSCDLLTDEARQLIDFCLSPLGSIGLAVESDPDGLRVWLFGRLIEEEMELLFPGMMESLAPVNVRESPRFPDEALFHYQAGVPPRIMHTWFEGFMQACWPERSSKLEEERIAFREHTGLDLQLDFFSALAPQFSLACLPPGSADESWPFPRSVAAVRVLDNEKVDRFMQKALAWKASRVAPFTCGMISAMKINDRHEGVELSTIQLDSLVPMPLPSPTFALASGYLIASPVKSAVQEMISFMHAQPEGRLAPAAHLPHLDHPEAVEWVHYNFAAWNEVWKECGPLALSFCRLFFVKHDASGFDHEQEDAWRHAVDRVFRFLGTLPPATGVTTVEEDGWFTFCLTPDRST